MPSAPITAFPFRFAQRVVQSLQHSRFGGCAWASASNESDPGIRNRTVGMSACNLTLKKEATRPAAAKLFQTASQVRRFHRGVQPRTPHERSDMKCPGGSLLFFLPPLSGHSGTQLPVSTTRRSSAPTVAACVCNRKKINLSTCLAGHAVGIKEVDRGHLARYFMDYDSVIIDLRKKLCSPLTTLRAKSSYLCL